jgi:hypothetical protein
MSEPASVESVRAVFAADDAAAEARSSAADEFEEWFRSAVADVPGLATETYNALRRSADEFKARLRAKEK